MKILIVGCGNVGQTLADYLTREGHDIVVIDQRHDRLKKINADVDVMGVQGNGTDRDVLETAGVKEADLVIAVTESDELNLLSCLIAKKCGAKHTIARVRNPLYDRQMQLIQEDLGLSMCINPESAAAMVIARLLKLPSAIEAETFAQGQIELSKFQLSQDSILVNTALKNIQSKIHCDILICIVERNDKAIIPDGDFVLQAGDRISVLATPKNIITFYKQLNLYSKKVDDAMIVGGSSTAIYLAKQLVNMGIRVKIIDKDRACCEDLCEKLPNVSIACGDATDRSVLLEEGIEKVQAFVALTDMDEQNIMLTMFAKSINSRAKMITRVHLPNYYEMVANMDLGSVIYPRKTMADNIVSYVRGMDNSRESSNVEALHYMADGKVEALEFNIHEHSKVIDIPLAQLATKDNLLVSCIRREGKVIIPGGQERIQTGDTVIIITTHSGLKHIDDIQR